MILTLSVLTLPSSREFSALGERPRVGCFVVGVGELLVVLDVVEDAEAFFFKVVAIFVRIFLKSASELRIKFFRFDNSSSGGFVLPLYLSVFEAVVKVAVEVLIVVVFVGFSRVDEGMLTLLLLLFFRLVSCLLQILPVIPSISARALFEPPVDLEQRSGSKVPRFLPSFCFPRSLSVLEQSTWEHSSILYFSVIWIGIIKTEIQIKITESIYVVGRPTKYLGDPSKSLPIPL